MTKQVALVTGGTSGIGLAFAEYLLPTHTVVVCGRRHAGLDFARERLLGVVAIPCDMTRLTDLTALVSEVDRKFGRLDLLVSNAGVASEFHFPAGIDVQAAAAEVELNLTAPIQLTSLALPLLRRSSAPAIVYVTSGYALAPATRAPVYSAAKAGLRSFAKAIRRQLADEGVHVVEVIPPVVDTPAVAHRGVKKIPPEAVVTATLDALKRRRPEAFVGQTRALPVLLRLAPGFAERLVARS